MKTTELYNMRLRKPSWAPPAWLFAPVWSVLYLIIGVSYGTVAYMYMQGSIPFSVALPFLLNIIANAAFNPIEFGMRNLFLATIDIVLVLVTLVWAMFAIYPHAAWISVVNIPYLFWVSFATILQATVLRLNWSRWWRY